MRWALGQREQSRCPLATVLRSCQGPASEAAGARDVAMIAPARTGRAGPGRRSHVVLRPPAVSERSLCLPPAPPLPAAKASFRFLAVFVVVPLSAVLYRVARKRAKTLLCPLLPKPGSSEALKFPAPETSQAKPQLGFVEPSENISPVELLVTELVWDKEVPEASTETCSLLRCAAADDPAETPPAKEGRAGGETELPFEYRRQELLPGMGEAQEDRAGGCGQSSPGDEVLGCSQPPPAGGSALEAAGPPQPLVPLSLLLSDKPVTIKNGGSLEL